jgi:hypothetical protein
MTSCSWLATGTAALAVDVSSGPKMKLAWTWVTHLCTRAAAVAGSDASFSGTRVTLWPRTPPPLLTMFAQAVAPSSSLTPSWLKGPDVAPISQMVMGELAEPPPPPELHPAATPTTRTALAAALLTTRRRRERSRSLAAAACGFRKNRRATANRESSIKAPFGFGQDCMPARPFLSRSSPG